ncbi:MAG: DNA gyrase subunit A [Acidobacteriota bacterium]
MSTEQRDIRLPVNIEDEMRKSYLEYAMSVIVGRALPDVRDGLKPVHRRVLFAMHDLKNDYNKPYKKSARVVGDVIGKYHPHGDAAVYDTIVRMVQDFSLRCPLIDGQGNFGSVDGDAPAAMRYTEIRMHRLAHEMLADIEKDTVDFGPNYDETLKEPLILPSRFPNLLVNGSSGIAVGMSTNIPPHNLGEVVKGIIASIKNPDISVAELMDFLPGPDFPTAGIIQGREGIRQAYATGRGTICMRARVTVEPFSKDRNRLLITEIPYQVNKAELISKIAERVRARKLEGISDIRDESDREGMRIVIELKRGEMPSVVLNKLYKHSRLQQSFGIIMLAIVHGRPRVLNLKDVMRHFVEHRREVVVRRTRFDLRKAEERAHILQGLKIALDNLDAVVALIRKAQSPQEAREGLRLRFKLSEIQAQAILDMRLQRLTGLERKKIVDEYQNILEVIKNLKEILASDQLVDSIIIEELQGISKTFADSRRTEIVSSEVEDFTTENLIAEEDMVVTVSHSGYIKRSPLDTYRAQHRGGKGRIGMVLNQEDFVEEMFVASTHAYVLCFTNRGRVHWLKVYAIPEVGAAAKGKAIVNLVALQPGDSVAAQLVVRAFAEDRFVVMATKNGIVKKTPLSAFSHPRVSGIIALSIDEDDSLFSVRLTDGNDDIFLATRSGMSIRFPEKNVRAMGRSARGVRGISVGEGDHVVEMETVSGDDGSILSVTENGYGKRTRLQEYRSQRRGGKGRINIRVTPKNGPVIGVKRVDDTAEVMLITSHGKIIRMAARGISVIGRATQGVRVIDVSGDDKVVALARLPGSGNEQAS